ncbi:MAG: hypothetical protein ACI8S6_003517, partial [Myxococcota bacterium]
MVVRREAPMLQLMAALLVGCAAKKSTSPETTFSPQTGVLDESFTDSSGVTGKLRIIVPEDIAEGDYGVLLFFGWDGSDSYYKEEADLHEPLATAHQLVVVSLTTPETDRASGCWWAPEVEDNAAYVAELV